MDRGLTPTKAIQLYLRIILRAVKPQKRIVTLFFGIGLLIFWNAHKASGPDSLEWTSQTSGESLESKDLPCRSLQGADETLVILRTGSTELDDRFRVHLSTTLRCYPNHLLFSDFEEDYHGEHIRDALSSVSANIKNHHADFAIYRRLQDGGRKILHPSELSGSPSKADIKTGNLKNPGWKLDKFKFMPMVNQTFHEYPGMKWYVFLEADTYVLWPMLLRYLSLVDHTEPYYAGSAQCMGPNLFAHGGSGFVVSQPAMRAVTQYYAEHKAEIEAYTDVQWAGDFVLGKALKDAGVNFTDAWPHFRGEYPGIIDYTGPEGRYEPNAGLREWCMPTVSYHHMSSDMVEGLWHWEQQWISAAGQLDTLTHGDVFRGYVVPQMMKGEKSGWDNLSHKDGVKTSNVEECRTYCESQPSCLQYSFVHETGQCETGTAPRLGKKAESMHSGWLKDRVLDFARKAPPCGTEEWLVGKASRTPSC